MKKSTLALVLFSIIGISTFAQNSIDSLKTVLSELTSQKDRLETLDELTKQMIRSNHSGQKEYIAQYMTLAKELEEYDLMASKSRFLIQQYIYSGEFDKAIQLCDSMLEYKPKFKQVKSEAHILLKKAGVYSGQLNYAPSISLYKRAAKLFMQSGDSIFAADSYLFCGSSLSEMGEDIEGLNYLEKAGELFELLGDYNYMIDAGMRSDLLLRRNGLYLESDTNVLELIEKSKKYKAFDLLATLYFDRAEYKGFYKGDLELAKKYIDSGKTYVSKARNNFTRKMTERNSSLVSMMYHLKKKEYSKADKFFAEVEEKEKSIPFPKAIRDADYVRIMYYTDKGDYATALNYLKSYKEDVSKINSRNFYHLSLEKLLAEVHDKLGNFKKSNQHYTTFIRQKDSLNKIHSERAFAYHQAKFKTAEKEKEIIQQESEIQQLASEKTLSESRTYTILAILLSVILIFIGIWWRGRLRRKALALEIERNKQELAGFTQQLIQKSSEQEILKEQLEKLQLENKEEETLTVISDLAASKILTKDDWYNFKEKFTKVYPTFYNNIQKKGYQLTKSEERLITLEKLELDNYEISRMLGVSTDTIFMSRYRLRKKINAPKDIPLVDYFEKAL